MIKSPKEETEGGTLVQPTTEYNHSIINGGQSLLNPMSINSKMFKSTVSEQEQMQKSRAYLTSKQLKQNRMHECKLYYSLLSNPQFKRLKK